MFRQFHARYMSRCGGNTTASANFPLDTDASPCAGWTVPSTDVLVDTIWSPGSIKKHPVGQGVTLLPLPITRTFGLRFYIEAPDRSSGIGATLSLTADPGRMATVTGILAEEEGEVVLSSPSVQLGEMGAALDPLGMSSNALRLDAGVDPTGLLATVWGRVLSVPESETYYTI